MEAISEQKIQNPENLELSILEDQRAELDKIEENISTNFEEKIHPIETFKGKCLECSSESEKDICKECEKDKKSNKEFIGTSLVSSFIGGGMTAIFTYDPLTITAIAVLSGILGVVSYKLVSSKL